MEVKKQPQEHTDADRGRNMYEKGSTFPLKARFDDIPEHNGHPRKSGKTGSKDKEINQNISPNQLQAMTNYLNKN